MTTRRQIRQAIMSGSLLLAGLPCSAQTEEAPVPQAVERTPSLRDARGWKKEIEELRKHYVTKDAQGNSHINTPYGRMDVSKNKDVRVQSPLLSAEKAAGKGAAGGGVNLKSPLIPPSKNVSVDTIAGSVSKPAAPGSVNVKSSFVTIEKDDSGEETLILHMPEKHKTAGGVAEPNTVHTLPPMTRKSSYARAAEQESPEQTWTQPNSVSTLEAGAHDAQVVNTGAASSSQADGVAETTPEVSSDPDAPVMPPAYVPEPEAKKPISDKPFTKVEEKPAAIMITTPQPKLRVWGAQPKPEAKVQVPQAQGGASPTLFMKVPDSAPSAPRPKVESRARAPELMPGFSVPLPAVSNNRAPHSESRNWGSAANFGEQQGFDRNPQTGRTGKQSLMQVWTRNGPVTINSDGTPVRRTPVRSFAASSPVVPDGGRLQQIQSPVAPQPQTSAPAAAQQPEQPGKPAAGCTFSQEWFPSGRAAAPRTVNDVWAGYNVRRKPASPAPQTQQAAPQAQGAPNTAAQNVPPDAAPRAPEVQPLPPAALSITASPGQLSIPASLSVPTMPVTVPAAPAQQAAPGDAAKTQTQTQTSNEYDADSWHQDMGDWKPNHDNTNWRDEWNVFGK